MSAQLHEMVVRERELDARTLGRHPHPAPLAAGRRRDRRRPPRGVGAGRQRAPPCSAAPLGEVLDAFNHPWLHPPPRPPVAHTRSTTRTRPPPSPPAARPGVWRRGRAPDDERRRQHDGRRAPPRDRVQHELGGVPARLLERLVHRREAGDARDLEIVVAHHREVVGHAQAADARRLDDGQRDQVVRRDDRRRRLGQGEEAGGALRRRPRRLPAALDDERGVVLLRAAPPRRRRRSRGVAVATTCSPSRAAARRRRSRSGGGRARRGAPSRSVPRRGRRSPPTCASGAGGRRACTGRPPLVEIAELGLRWGPPQTTTIPSTRVRVATAVSARARRAGVSALPREVSKPRSASASIRPRRRRAVDAFSRCGATIPIVCVRPSESRRAAAFGR